MNVFYFRFLQVCTLLDSRFKDCIFNREQRIIAKEKLITALSELAAKDEALFSTNETDDQPPPKILKLSAGASLLQGLLHECTNRKSASDEENIPDSLMMVKYTEFYAINYLF